jgi:hypothetical protein
MKLKTLAASRLGTSARLLVPLIFFSVAVQLIAGCSGVVVPGVHDLLSILTGSIPSAKQQTAYSATLSASGGTAPYTWSLSSGSLPAGLTLSGSAGQISGMPSQTGTSSFTVQVADSSSPPQTAKQQLSITVSGATATLQISSTSIPSGQVGVAYSDTLSVSGGTSPYTWSVSSGSLPTGLSLNSSTGQISGTPTKSGSYSFSVEVTDSSSPAQTATQALSTTIAAGTAQLAIATQSLSNGAQGSAYSATLSATGGTSPYSWSISSGALPPGATLNSSSGLINGTLTQAGTFFFTVKVVDSSSPAQSTTANLSIVVEAAELQISTATLPGAATSTAYYTTVAATGGTAPYTWSLSSGSLPAGLTLSSSGQITGTPTTSGTSTFTIQVKDSSSPAQTASKSFTITVAASGGTLQLTTVSLPNGEVGVSYSTALAAVGGIQPYTWSVTSGTLPAGLTLSSATISGTPTQSGTSVITLQVQDSSATPQKASKSFSLAIAAAVVPVSISTSSLASGQVSSAYAATLTASGGTAPYAWSVSSGTLPAGLSLNASSGQISGTPTQAGTSTFTLQVKDSSSPAQTSTKSLSITIAAAVTPVQITTASLTSGQVGSTYSASLAASGGTTPYTWSISSGALPTGLTLSSAGSIAGTPTASGTFSFTIKVTDSTTPTAQTATKALSLTVAAAVTAVQITTASVPSGQVGTAYSTSLAASGGTTPYTWSMSSGALPAGLTLSATGAISGTPTASGSFTFTAKVTDSTTPTAQTATKSLSLTIAAAVTAVQITTTSVPSGQVGTSYSTTLAASGGTTPYTWSISSGALPAGLTLSAGGTLSGTPTASGSFTFAAKVTDSTTPTAQTATQSFTLTIAAAVPTLQITTSTIPAGQVNVAYSTQFTASGGTTPYTWSLSSGALPAGTSLASSTGIFSGTPTTSGSFTFTVKVTDSTTPTAQTATKSVTFTVAAAAGPVQITTTSLPAGQTSVAYSATLQANQGTTPYTWSLTSGSLPTGLTLSAAGTISGTPTATGTSNFTVLVTDSSSPATTATASFSITISAGSGYSVDLTWTASPSSGVTGYNVYRSTVNGSGYAKITSSPVSGLTYTDSTVAASTTYYYVVTSVDGSGDESGYSEVLQMVIP